MKIDVYTEAGTKKGSVDLPSALFDAPIREGLMHLAVQRQQNNRRTANAHVKSRGEVQGSTRKLFQQKGTGRARRGSVRSPLLRGGGKIFGPRNVRNYEKDMPKKMRRAALFSCLSSRAKDGIIVGLESYSNDIKTKKLQDLLKKMSLPLGRKIVIVIPEQHKGLQLSARNIPRVKTVQAAYLNPEDILSAHNIVFLVDALKVAEETFTKSEKSGVKSEEKKKAPNSKLETSDKESSAKKSTPKKSSTSTK